MSRAVRFNEYGGVDVLQVVEVEDPEPGAGQVLVRVKATSINPGEAKIREGALHDRFPATFPSGEGSDMAGVIEALGPDVDGFSVGDAVIGWSDERSAHAELVVVERANLTRKPPELPGRSRARCSWPARPRGPRSARSGPPRATRSSLPARPAASACSPSSSPSTPARASSAWPASATTTGCAPTGSCRLTYGDGHVADRIRQAAPDGVDAFIDLVGGGYVALALDELGVAPARVDTVADFEAIGKRGVKGEGNAAGASAAVLAELAGLIVAGELEVPIDGHLPARPGRGRLRGARQGPHPRQDRAAAVTAAVSRRAVARAPSDERARAILDRVRAVPEGFVRTYGDISPGAPRLAGTVLSGCQDPAVPWHRIVRADGSLAKGDRQRRLLDREGVPFRGRARGHGRRPDGRVRRGACRDLGPARDHVRAAAAWLSPRHRARC